MAATGTKTVTGVIPPGLNTGATTAATSGGAAFPLNVSGNLLSFDAVGMGDVPDNATLTSISYTYAGKVWVDWTIFSGSNPFITGFSNNMTVDGPGAGASVGSFAYSQNVTSGSSGTFIFTPVPGGTVNVAGGDMPLFDFANTASPTVSFLLTGNGSFSIGADNGVDGIQFIRSGVDVTINYNWQTQETNVPEASTYAAGLGLAGIVGFSWMRNRRR